MSKAKQKEELAILALVTFYDTLLYKHNIEANDAVNYIKSTDNLKSIYTEDDVMICMMHDDTLEKFADSVGEKIKWLEK